MSNLLDIAAEVGSEEDEDYDGEAGEEVTRNKDRRQDDVDDSSEEEEDDDPEAERQLREGFIVDEDEDDDDGRRARRKAKKKRRREEREEEDEELMEDDLEIAGLISDEPPKSKFKRLKQGHKGDRAAREPRGIDDIFSDDDMEDLRREPRGGQDEFADFIEEDVFDDEEGLADEEDREVARPGRKSMGGMAYPEAGLDEAEMEDYRAAFGDGTEYDWALELQDEMDVEEQGADRPLELKDVFEPSQLVEKMLTDEDNQIRAIDVPERFQLARKSFKPVDLPHEELMSRMGKEAKWITDLMFPKKSISGNYREPFEKAVKKVLEFMNVDELEVPFIFLHRKDYLIHSGSTEQDQDDPDAASGPQRLLMSSDLWDVFDYDLKYRALSEKRDTLQRTYDNVRSVTGLEHDPIVEEMIDAAISMEEIQDIQDYIHFRYSAELKDVNAMEAEANGVQKRARATNVNYERIRASKIYNLVRAIGITPDDFAKNVMASLSSGGRKVYTEDAAERPDDMADALLEPPTYDTGAKVLRAARQMYAEELVTSPRVRKLVRLLFYQAGSLNCIRTEKGLRKISEDHPYYELKYLRNQQYQDMARRPELFLKMLKAEDDGLIEVKIKLSNYDKIKKDLEANIVSDNYSEVADAWNALRKEVLGLAWPKLERIISHGVKETLKAECESALARVCRERYLEKLDQAPYKPKGMALGTVPRVLTLSNGMGERRDAICYAFLEDDGRIVDQGKYTLLRTGNSEKRTADDPDVEKFVELVRRRKPDVIGVSGRSIETRRLMNDIQTIVENFDLRGAEYEDENGRETSDRLEVVMVNDEVARLYMSSERAALDHPGQPEQIKYCAGLARYLQSPMKEYAALGKDITSITFDQNQILLPHDKLQRQLETAMVDIVNMVGVDISDAQTSSYTANLLPYVCGLGPRKAQQMLKVISMNNGLESRAELVGDLERDIRPAVGPRVWQNCASFIYLIYEPLEQESDYLDNTRVHPEDYDLGRKMAADALELDEEDVKAETDEGGPSAVVRKLVRDEAQEKVNDLVLEEYAEQLERKFNQLKRATLETIRAELQEPYEELRANYSYMSSEEVFTMLVGETRETFHENMVVPVRIKKIFPDHIEIKLENGLEGGVSEICYPDGVGGERGVHPREVFSVGQTVQGKITFLERKKFQVQVSFKEADFKIKNTVSRVEGEWDFAQEHADKREEVKKKEDTTGRVQRVIKHPLFRPFDSRQAEEYLGTQSRGDVVIRPSGKGLDHLAVTWKVATGVFQHIDVLELDKENEYSLGRTLKIGGRYTYSDLDELIANHVQAMSKKVDEIMTDEKYKEGSKTATDEWLTTYTEANPRRSTYAFCINTQYPGYFHMCFKAGLTAPPGHWPIKIIPGAYEMRGNQYPSMKALKNGFKLMVTSEQAKAAQKRSGVL
ncbi:transcription elongation factor spt6 [Saccharata proteae CBS 121410]|uniref:Transcription elongation factor Spt6 n=1 Tax=Saccharata proteae CBS 121410 TaxID=1314787 RepID=A0A9P4LWS2_9PEZI|nr:transcription elongation factor spt6 [Saccharata proteae CBS 121410]